VSHGFVLAGGASTRMGRDKALLPFAGRTLLEHVAARVAEAAGNVTVIGPPERYGHLGLVCAADLVVAAASARFTLAYTRVGLTPDGSSSFFLPRLVGARRALELMLTNRTLTAAEALDWGLVNEVVPDEQLAERAGALARSLADGPTAAFASVKRLLQQSAQESLEAQLEHESRAISDAARSADAREGMAAFFEKRPAKFQGH